MFIDTHAHIYLKDFDDDLDLMLENSQNQGISHIFMPNIDLSTVEQMNVLQNRYPFCHSMIGLHPCHAQENTRGDIKSIEKILSDAPDLYAGIGETGIDFYWDRNFDEAQVFAFEAQIDMAIHSQKPIIIHSRDSLDTTIGIIKKHQKGNLTGIFHCFNGTLSQGNEIIDLGFYLGIGGVITYKNAGVDKVVSELPLTSMVLETDAPYLSPVPYRGKRNECSYLIHTAEKLSELKNVTLEIISLITSRNAKDIFKNSFNQ
ncbi:MAG: TatD family hydrolase [Lewinellaceae bacterium]|nr:TatD family hydrolase [Lewinellaceae bacterium]